MTDDRSTVSPLRRIAIAGGGTAGWMAAAALAKVLGPACEITLVESPLIATVGVGEATIPALAGFHDFLGVDEADFLRATQGSYKLGIDFRDWRVLGENFFHPFGPYGIGVDHALFQSHWLRDRARGRATSLDAWSVTRLAATQDRFGPAVRADPVMSRMGYAYHMDAGLYARFLRAFAEARGVARIEGEIVEVAQDDAGAIASLRLADGRSVEADFFIDCSGFRSLLCGQTLETGFIDWSHWLPCDRAVAIQCEHPNADRLPYTQAIALEAGWQWRIPLRHRIGNGYVYSSAFLSDGDAEDRLMGRLKAPIGELRRLKFKAGRRAKAWNRNCLALGLAGGFLEPLESTSIHLIQTGIARFISLFPDRACAPALRDEYNRQTMLEYEGIRDFILLHYTSTRRTDTPLWRHMQTIEVPETLACKQALYEKTGHIVLSDYETFGQANWLAIYSGFHIWPQTWPPAIDALETPALQAHFAGMRDLIGAAVARLPSHADYLQAHFPG